MKHHITLLIAALCMVACSRQSRHWDTLMQVDSFIEQHPDSALTVLQRINAAELTGNKERAKHALLLSMAMDKNYIDRTDFEVLQPAIDYYETHGTATDRLRTLYYEGRIYQNRGEKDRAMQTFIKAREQGGEITDTLTYANLLVAQSTYLYSSYKTDEFIKNHLQAAELYQAIGRPYYHITSLTKALSGSIINEDKQLADSLLSRCRSNIKEHPDYGSLMIPHVISYTITFGTEEEIKQVADLCHTDSLLSDNAKLSIAYGYSRIGEPGKALQVLESILPETIEAEPLKYLAIKSKVLEANQMYEEALDNYKLYTTALERNHQELFSQDLLFAQEKHDMEVDSLLEIQKRNKLIWYSISCALALLCMAGIIYYRYRIGRTRQIIAEQENANLRLEQENLSMRNSQLESESENLKALLAEQEELSAPVADAIKVRIEMLNGLLAATISANETYAQPYSAWKEQITEDKQAFMASTRLAFKASHPRFMRYLEEHGLTDSELNYLCLYAIGLRGKEIGEYTQQKRHYHISSDIRKKLGIDEHETNLGIYVRKLMKKL